MTMFHRGLAVAALLAAAPALAAPNESCAIPGTPKPSVNAPAVAPAPERIPSDYPRISDAAGNRTLAWLIAPGGTEWFDLGTSPGGVRLIYGQAPGVSPPQWRHYHILPNGEVVAGGDLFLPSRPKDERSFSVPRLEKIPGLKPRVDARGVQAPPADLKPLADVSYGVLGDPTTPRVWMMFDPLCNYSGPAVDELRPAIEAGKLHLALVPVPMLDPGGAGASTKAASYLAAARATMATEWTRMVEGLRAGRPIPEPAAGGDALMRRNREAMRALRITHSPFFLWPGPDGSPNGIAGKGHGEKILAALEGGR